MSSEELESMEIYELRNRLQTTIKREGMEGKLRAQLRSWLVRKMENDDDSVRRNRFGPKEKAMNCLVMEYLKAMHLNLTLSVFLSEAGLSHEDWQRDDVLDVLKLDPRAMSGQKDGPDLVKLIEEFERTMNQDLESDLNAETSKREKLEKVHVKLKKHFDTLKKRQTG